MQLQAPTGWFRLIGPVFFCDLARTARRRSYLVIRWSYPVAVFALMLMVFAIWSIYDDSSPKSSADFCVAFFGIYMSFNLLAVFLLTPAYAAGALAEEKEHQTLDALLASDLRDREIVLGTYLSRITKLGLIFLAPLPLFSFLQFLGGLEPLLIVAGFAFTAMSMCSLAALSLFFSVRSTKPRDALMKTYMATLVFIAVLTLIWAAIRSIPQWADYPSTDTWRSPVTAEDMVIWANIGNPVVLWLEVVREIAMGSTLEKLLPGLFARYAAFHGALVLFACSYAVLYLRRYALGMNEVTGKQIRQDYSIKCRLRSNWSFLPLLANRPMLWKELFVDRKLGKSVLRRLLFGLGITILLLPFIHVRYFFHGQVFPIHYPRSSELMSLWLRFLCAMLGCIALLQTLATAAGSISGERDKQTLAELLATPLTNRAIFFAKWQSAVFRFGSASEALVGLGCIGLCTGSLHPAAIFAFLVCWLTFAAFLASMGIWFSVVCRTTRQATAAAFLTCSVIVGCALLASYNLAEKYIPIFEVVGLFPAAMLAYVTFTPGEWTSWLNNEVAFRPAVYLFDLSFWCLCSIGLFMAARSRFGVLTGRLEGDLETTSSPALSPMENWKIESQPQPGWSQVLVRMLSFYGRRLGFLAIMLLPVLVLIAVYQVRALRGAEDLRGLLARLDASDPGWQDFLTPEAGASGVSETHGARAIMLRAEKLLPDGFPDAKLETALTQDLPDRALLPEALWQTIQASQKSTAVALNEIRKVGDMRRDDLREPGNPGKFQTQAFGWKLSRLIALDLMIRLQEGRPDEALAQVGAMLTMAAAVGESAGGKEPSEWFQRTYILDSALKSVQRTLAQGEASDMALATLQNRLQKQDEPHIDSFLRMERAYLYRMLTQQQKEAFPGEWQFFAGARGSQNGKSNGVPTLPSIHELVYLTGKSLEVQRAEVLALLCNCIDGSFKGLHVPPMRPRFSRFITSSADLYLISLHRPASSVAYVRCHLRATIVALALERYRREHGGWPSSLDELTPKYLKSIPLGQWDGKPLIYKRLKDGAIVYTLGGDLVDHGGSLARYSWNLERFDVGVRLWDVSSRRQQIKAVDGGR